MFWFLLGCQFSPDSISEEETFFCDPRTLSEKEIRLRPLFCGDDNISAGAIRRGDWILENNQIRIGLREIGSSLSTLEGSGGSIVDLALFGKKDSLLEILPYQNGILDVEAWEIIETEEEISIELYPLEAGIRLKIDQNQLQFWGDTKWLFRPPEGTEQIGQELILSNQDNILFIDGNIEDLGGDLIFSELNAIRIASPSNIFQSQENALFIEVQATGEKLVFYQEETLLGFLPIEDEEAKGHIPPETTHIQAQKQGCISSPLTEISETEVNIGECGSLLIRLDENGEEKHGILWVNQRAHFIAKEGHRLHFSQELIDIRIDAGLEFEPIDIESINPLENPSLEYPLQRALPDTHSISLHNLISPDHQIRESREEIILQNLGQQVDYVILSARNVVPSYQNPLSKQLRKEILFEEGLISEHADGSFLSFPWYSSGQPAFGAIRIDTLDFESSIAIGAQRDRFLILDYSAESEINPEILWQQPSFLWITSAEEALDFAQNCGSFPYSKPVSDHIWLPHLDQKSPSKKELEHELRTGSLGLGNGPLLKITQINLNESRDDLLNIYLHGNREHHPQNLRLYSEQGEERAWEITEFPFQQTILLPERDVFCLVAWSEESDDSPWALSTPFYP